MHKHICPVGHRLAFLGDPRHAKQSMTNGTDKENPSLVSSGDREIPTRGSIVPVGNEALPSFPLERWTRGLGFPGFHCTPVIDSISSHT